jgi:hypothetical protein
MKMKKFKFFVVIGTILIFFSCNNNGRKFEGIWKNISNINDQFRIKKSGENFIIEAGKNDKVIASLINEDKLHVTIGGETIDIAYLKESRHLLVTTSKGAEEYEKVDNSDTFQSNMKGEFVSPRDLKELKEERVADSIRVADSLAMVQAKQQRKSDSIRATSH